MASHVCTLVNALVGTRTPPPAQVACRCCPASASEVFALIDGRINTTSASCRGSRPSWALIGAGCSNPLQLVPVVFFLPPTSADNELVLGQLALYGGVFWWWYTYAHVMVVVVAMGWFHPLQCAVIIIWICEVGMCDGDTVFSLSLPDLQKEGTGLAGLGFMYLNGVGVEKVHSQWNLYCITSFMCLCKCTVTYACLLPCRTSTRPTRSSASLPTVGRWTDMCFWENCC